MAFRKIKHAGKQTAALEKKPKQPTNKPKFDSITIKLSEEGTKFMCGVGLEVG